MSIIENLQNILKQQNPNEFKKSQEFISDFVKHMEIRNNVIKNNFKITDNGKPLEYVDQDLLPKIINNPKLHNDLYIKNLQQNAREYSNFYKTSTSIIPKFVDDQAGLP